MAESWPSEGIDTPSALSRPLLDLRDTGILWLINRVVFHPRGFALALDVETNEVGEPTEVTGWRLQGDGSECWVFSAESDDKHLAEVEALFAAHRRP